MASRSHRAIEEFALQIVAMRALSLLMVLALVATAGAAGSREATGAVDERLPFGEPHVGPGPEADGEIAVRGVVLLPVPVAAAFDEATDFEDWPRELPDLQSFELLERSARHATVKYKSSIIGVTTTTDFALDPPSGMTFSTRGTGLGDVQGVMSFEPAENGTLVALTITSRRKGFVSRLAPESTIRGRLQRKIGSDLLSLVRDTSTQQRPRGSTGGRNPAPPDDSRPPRG